MSFQEICNIIILVASTVTAIGVIYTVFKKPAVSIKQKHKDALVTTIKDVLTEILPGMLAEHDLLIRDKYRNDREAYLLEIRNSVLNQTRKELDQITQLYNQYEPLAISAKDVIREKIVKIYRDNKDSKTLSIIEKERLDQYYKDYKALKGNSYIDKYYKRMSAWAIDEDDYEEDDELL